jgi:hypothetical protein
MRKRQISYVAALGLALAVAIPGSAMASGTQNVQAGFVPQLSASVPIPAPNSDTGPNDSKTGTLFTRLFLSGFGATPSAAGVFDIHAPEELKFESKGLAQCDPALIKGKTAAEASSICEDSLLGTGNASAFVTAAITIDGPVTLFNGTPQNGFPTVLFHSTAGTPITLVAEMQDSPLAGYGTLFHTLVAVGAGGSVPDGTPIVDTDFTLSKNYTDEKLAKKAKKTKKKANKASGKKAKKLKKKAKKQKKASKKSWVVGNCTDGELKTQVNVSYVGAAGGPPQTATSTQSCT